MPDETSVTIEQLPMGESQPTDYVHFRRPGFGAGSRDYRQSKQEFLSSAPILVDTIDGMRAIEGPKTGMAAQVTTTGRAGLFRWQSGDLSAECAADPDRLVYVPSDDDPSGEAGAWVLVGPSYLARQYADETAASAVAEANECTNEALAGISAGAPMFATVQDGIDNTQEGDFFNVAGDAGGDVYQSLYRHDPGGVANDMGVSVPSSLAVDRPKHVGQSNGWIDPFFRHLAVNQDFNGRRWFSASGSFTSLELVDNPVFKGRALRKNAPGTGNLCGPVIDLEDIGATVGDTVTVRAAVVGAGARAQFPMRFYASNMTPVADQIGDSPGQVTGPSVAVRTLQGVVPEGARYLWVYPITQTPDGYFDVVALWAGRGTPAEVPAWPNYNDLDYMLAAIREKQSADLEPDFYSYFGVGYLAEYSAAAAEIEAPTYSLAPRAAPFAGWANQFNAPAEMSFNLVRIPALSRSTPVSDADKWSFIKIEVRDIDRDGELLAYGQVMVDQDADFLSNLEFALLHPETNLPITITQDDVGATFMVGYVAYNRNGGYATAGECRGGAGAAEFSGVSYFKQAVFDAWNLFPSGLPMAINLYDASDLTVARKVSPFDSGSETVKPRIALPPHIYHSAGREINVYFDSLIYQRGRDYFWDVTCSRGVQYAECYRLDGAPTPGVVALTIAVQDAKTQEVLHSVTSQVRLAGANAGAGVSRNLLVIGDSTTANGATVSEVRNLFSTDVMSVATIGTQGAPTARHEGRSGWRINDYTTEGRTFFQFTVSGIVESPAINATEYDHNGSRYRVQQVDVDSSGDGVIISNRVSGTADPLPSGTLTKVSSSGDATIVFSAWQTVPGNPFWNAVTSKVDFTHYMNANGFTMTAGDWVIIHLGINDVFAETTDDGVDALTTSEFAKLDTLLASIHEYQPGIRIGLALPAMPPASQDAFGASYGAGQTQHRFKRNLHRWCLNLVETYGGREAENYFLLPFNSCWDTVNNAFAVEQPVNARSEIMVSRQRNGVHPSTGGYYQISDVIFSALKYHA